MMAQGAAESVAPTNYYTKVTVSKREEGGKKGETGATREDDSERKELDVPGYRDMKGRTCCHNVRPRQRALVHLGPSSR